MNVKKMFASLTGVLMLAQALPVAVLGAASYSDELKGAYEYAYSKNITTMSSIDNANMYGELTRGQLAKMIANWAEKEMGTKVDETAVCSFSDANTAEGDLATYVKKACQMGLMGQGIEKFRPNDKVTRGEFGTTLSRALWGDKYNGATPFYKNHLEALKEAGIMKMIDTPNQMEIRGYVMLMLQRSADVVSPAECKDPTVVLACSLNSDACPAKCKKTDDSTLTGAKAGDLQVSATAATNRKVIIGGTSDLDTINFKASQAIDLEKVVLERYGYSASTDVQEIWLEDENGAKMTNGKSLNSKDEVVLNIKKDYRHLDKNDVATVVVSVSSGAKAGGTLGFKIKEVVSSAKNVDLAKYSPYTYDMVNYSGTNVKIEVKGKDKTYHYVPGNSYEVSRLQVKASNASVLVNGLTLTQSGANLLDLSKYLDKVEVLVDGKAVAGVKSSIKRDELKLSFDAVKVEMRKNATFVVNASFKDLDRFGDKVSLVLANSTDFNAIEEKTQARVSIEELPGWDKYKVYTFNGSEINLTNKKLASTIDAARGSSDVVIGEGEIKIGEAIVLHDFAFKFDRTGIESMKMVVEGSDFDAVRASDGQTFTFKNVEIEKSGKVQFVVEIKDTESLSGTIKLEKTSFDRNLIGGEYVGKYDESGEKIAKKDFIGSISLSNVKVQPAKGALENFLTKEVEFLTAQSTQKVVFDGEYTAKKQNISLNEFTVNELNNANLTGDDRVNFHLYLAGKEVSSLELDAKDAQSISGSDVFSDVLVKKGEKIKVRLEANVYASTGASHTYTLTLKGEDKDGVAAGNANADTVKMKFVEKGSVVVSDNAVAPANTIVLRASNINLASFLVKPSNKAEGMKLENFTIGLTNSGTTITDKTKLRVKVAGEEVDSDNITADGAKIEVANISEDITEDGVKVEVSYKTELPVGTYTLTLNKVNKATPTKVFNKKVVDALVSVKTQENIGKATTKFTFKVEKYDDNVNVSALSLTGEHGRLLERNSIADGDTLEVSNGDKVELIEKIGYKVGTGSVVIEKKDFMDFFKVGDTYVKIFKASDN